MVEQDIRFFSAYISILVAYSITSVSVVAKTTAGVPSTGNGVSFSSEVKEVIRTTAEART